MSLRHALGLDSSSSPAPDRDASESLPLYSPISTNSSSLSSTTTAPSSPSVSSSDQGDLDLDKPHLYPAQRHSHPSSQSFFSWPQLPTMSRFLADFTLGFADGLTVPFALTAGLSSLGQTDTVVYAGAAEICAGSISMGIGGYLAARGERAAGEKNEDERGRVGGDNDEETEVGASEKMALAGQPGEEEVVEYLRVLRLPPDLMDVVLAHVAERPGVVRALREMNDGGEEDGSRSCSPMLAGLSVSLGYLLGGLMPLFPYFFVEQVGDGLFWSFGVCLLALFVFGFSKDHFLGRQRRKAEADNDELGQVRGVRLRELGGSAWEGLLMVMMGGVAALAAVFCVRLFEGLRVDPGAGPT